MKVRTMHPEPRKCTILPRNHQNFSKISYFFAIYIMLYGLLCTECVVQNVSELTILAYFYQIKEKILHCIRKISNLPTLKKNLPKNSVPWLL